MLRELSDLINWCQSTTYDRFINQKSLRKFISTNCNPIDLYRILLPNCFVLVGKPWHVVSLSDLYAQKLIQSCPEEFLSCNRLGLTRVYPNCSRVDSSNFNPQDMWNFGCQLGKLLQTACLMLCHHSFPV